MNKTAIKNFAVWARQKLIADITYKAGMLGITENGIAEKLPQSTNDLHFYDIGTKDYVEISGKEISQRSALVGAIKHKEKDIQNYKEVFQYVVEEVAYTWFNRLIAIRFMEVNDYLPSGVRVLSSENKAKNEPDFVTTPFDTDLEFTSYEQDKIIQLKDENKLDELFRMLFIKQCNKLHNILPELFEETDDYSELLLTISFTDKDDVVYRLVHDVDEDDFNIEKEGQVEIIGWMYQYYNIEPKAAVFARPNGKKISKEEIPAATQLFTPDWIVRYMVENSLGRIWVEGHSDNSLKDSWKYYIDEAEQEPEVMANLEKIKATYKALTPESIKIIDPCMGSGHILVYAFDVLMQIYESYGYTQRDAARSILENNIFGIDIDKRAYQLAYFAVMMKARQYNRRILTETIEPNLCFIKSSKEMSESALEKMGDYKNITQGLISEFQYAAEYGSIMSVSLSRDDLQNIYSQVNYIEEHKNDGNLIDAADCNEIVTALTFMLKQAKLLTQKYDVVVTNPPYMPVSNTGGKLNEYVKKNYPDSKTDLFAVFIERCNEMLKTNGYQAMITMHSWMFLSSYEKLRKKILLSNIINMVHLGAKAFEEIGGEVVQTTSFVIRKDYISDYKGVYCRLVEPNSQQAKEEIFLTCQNRYITGQSDFPRIPGSPVAYWVGKQVIKAFESSLLGDYAYPKQGFATGNNDTFLKFWYEVDLTKIGFGMGNRELANQSGKKWFPCNKGGSFRRWYGNNNYLANWQFDGKEMIEFRGSVIRNPQYYFRQGITWSSLASGKLSMRYSPKGFLFESKGSVCFMKDENNLLYILGLMNTKIVSNMLLVLSPTLDYHEGPISRVPIIMNDEKEAVEKCVKQNIEFCKDDWDSFETSWDFRKHPLLCYTSTTVSASFETWSKECHNRFNQLKVNEEELNRIFIDIYGLQDELTPEVEDKDVTVRKADLQRDIKSLVSYAVGCMFGRYSLDIDGIAYAGGEWDDSKYKTFIPDEDNCIPITDEEYFEDDIVGLFCAWLKKVYGEDTLEENLDFIANALGNKGKTSREVIRNYFLTDFIKDHIKTYQKRPIYWLFNSGKQNGFKALVYMHRWNADTTGNMRVEYLHRMQRVYEKEVERMQEIIENSRNNKEISNATKRKEKLQKQIKETKDYDAKIAHLALSRINIDLDDGVKVNYEKVQTADGKKMQILAKI
ncbi:MAG: BREX-1 system adenine-specific DNA-methyltransferase PglX [Firmicutes bacterium]|nr:BREX-1 system adenine-specific DNA-methyltransferase PglX [Bacillota bacterium]